MSRKFEKISLEEFHKNYGENEDIYYNNLTMPKRGSKYSARIRHSSTLGY